MTNFEFGDIVLVPFPFTDQTTTKKRPAVIISSEQYQHNKPDIILMAITSQTSTIQTFGEIAILDWQSAGLLKQSLIKPVVTTLEKQLILRRLGKLNIEDQKRLKKAIKKIFDV